MNEMVDQTKLATDAAEAFPVPNGTFAQEVLEVEHYTDRLFRFRIARPESFRFRSGEFVMIGLPGPKPVWRAYSVASPSWDDTVEFYSIKVPDGPLTSQLQKIKPGDTLWMKKKPTGTLVVDALLPGKTLWMFSTGTGIAPFASLIRDPEVYEKFERVILTHTCRDVAELAYGEHLVQHIREHEFLGELSEGKLTLFNSVTRDPSFPRQGRITDLLDSGSIFEQLGVPPISPEHDRGMICGSMAMLKDTKARLEGFGLEEGSNAKPGTFVVERAFVG